jgi:hypothetical protein
MNKSKEIASAVEAAAVEFINTAARRDLEHLASTEDGLGAGFDDRRVSVFAAQSSAPQVNRDIARNRLGGQASLVLMDLSIAFEDEDQFEDELAALTDDELRTRLLDQVGFIALDGLVSAEIEDGEGDSLA